MTETKTIDTAFGCCWTVTFRNRRLSDTELTTWVFTTKDAYDGDLRRLSYMGHIELVAWGPSIVKG